MANRTGNGTFKKGEDARRNNAGQRSREVVAFSRTLREIIATVGNEELRAKDGRVLTRVELAVRGLYNKAAKGDVSAFNAIAERVEGKITQPIGGPDGGPIPVAVQFIPYAGPDTNDS